MKEYINYSTEELRWEDYREGRVGEKSLDGDEFEFPFGGVEGELCGGVEGLEIKHGTEEQEAQGVAVSVVESNTVTAIDSKTLEYKKLIVIEKLLVAGCSFEELKEVMAWVGGGS